MCRCSYFCVWQASVRRIIPYIINHMDVGFSEGHTSGIREAKFKSKVKK